MTPALLWLDQRLAAQGTTSDDIVRVEHQRQAAMNVTVRNVIMSMSLMSALDWTEFFESVSLVDEVLRAGPNYAAMDFATRDAYRHAIEELARGSGRPELDVAREAMAQAHRADGADDDRRRDPGFHLIGDGRPAFEAALGYRAPPLRRLLRALRRPRRRPAIWARSPSSAALVLALPAPGGQARPAWDRRACSCSALLAVVPASDLAIALLNRSVAALVTPDGAAAARAARRRAAASANAWSPCRCC